MASKKQIEANRRNSRQSTGPRNTEKTRKNALKHGILARDPSILIGEEKKNYEAFENIKEGLRQDLLPAGTLENLLVDKLAWHMWRLGLIFQYEQGAIKMNYEPPPADSKNHNITISDLARLIKADDDDIHPNWTLPESINQRRKDILALEQVEPLEASPVPWYVVFKVAIDDFHIQIDDFFELECPWYDCEDFTRSEVQLVVEEVCRQNRLSEKEFWGIVRKEAWSLYDESKKEDPRDKMKREHGETLSETQKLLAVLPGEKYLENVHRHEAHVSRQFRLDFQLLQRLQASRMGNQRVMS